MIDNDPKIKELQNEKEMLLAKKRDEVKEAEKADADVRESKIELNREQEKLAKMVTAAANENEDVSDIDSEIVKIDQKIAVRTNELAQKATRDLDKAA